MLWLAEGGGGGGGYKIMESIPKSQKAIATFQSTPAKRACARCRNMAMENEGEPGMGSIFFPEGLFGLIKRGRLSHGTCQLITCGK